MFIIHARVVLTGNLVHVWIHRENRVSLVCLYLTSSLIKDGYVSCHRHVLSFDERDHIIREWCDGLDPSVSLALWSFSLLLLLSSWLIHVPMTMRLCNSRIPEEHLVCYQMSQRNWVIIKMLYMYLRRCLLVWHRLRSGFVTPSIGEVSLGPLGSAHHNKPSKQCD